MSTPVACLAVHLSLGFGARHVERTAGAKFESGWIGCEGLLQRLHAGGSADQEHVGARFAKMPTVTTPGIWLKRFSISTGFAIRRSCTSRMSLPLSVTKPSR